MFNTVLPMDGFENSMYKAKATGLRRQGQDQWSSRSRPRPTAHDKYTVKAQVVFFDAKAEANI